MPLLMRFVEGYTYVEIAEQLDLSESAVKMRVLRGAKKLRGLYEDRVGKDELPTTTSRGKRSSVKPPPDASSAGKGGN